MIYDSVDPVTSFCIDPIWQYSYHSSWDQWKVALYDNSRVKTQVWDNNFSCILGSYSLCLILSGMRYSLVRYTLGRYTLIRYSLVRYSLTAILWSDTLWPLISFSGPIFSGPITLWSNTAWSDTVWSDNTSLWSEILSRPILLIERNLYGHIIISILTKRDIKKLDTRQNSFT